MKKLNPGIQVTNRAAMGTTAQRRPSFVQPNMTVLNVNPDTNHYEGQGTLSRSVL